MRYAATAEATGSMDDVLNSQIFGSFPKLGYPNIDPKIL